MPVNTSKLSGIVVVECNTTNTIFVPYNTLGDSRITASPATRRELRGYKRKPGRPRKNWMNIIRRDLKDMDTTWDEAEELATDGAEWRQRVAQCFHQMRVELEC